MLRGLLLVLTASARAAARRPTTDDPTEPGPLPTTHEEYRLEAAVDELVLPDRMVEYWAVVWRPVGVPNLEARLPVVIFLHGNHATCGTGEAPRVDSNSQYTMTGTCPPGFILPL